MTVRELIEKLELYEQDNPVEIYGYGDLNFVLGIDESGKRLVQLSTED
jgi:hypothetical protein